jgi:uncharacterized membrane protein
MSGMTELSRSAHRVLGAVVAVILVGTVTGMALMWPRGEAPRSQQVTDAFEGVEIVRGSVVSTTSDTCPGMSEDRLPSGEIPLEARCATSVIALDEGIDGNEAGQEVDVIIPYPVFAAGIAEGDSVDVARYTDPEGGEAVWAWVDFSRELPLGLLAGAFALLVVAVGRLRGVAAIAGLVMGYLTVFVFMLPALLEEKDPVLVALLGSVAIMTVVLYLAHGFTAKTTAALVGTVVGLAITAGLATWATRASHLNGLSTEESFDLTQITALPDLSGLILCGIIVAGLGVLNDVTITQASAVWELRQLAPQLGFGELFSSGMRIGRDHLASTVYTIAFAYAGAALPTLLLISVYDRPLLQTLTSAEIAEEIVRTLVGSIGLVLAIPLTTAVAALLVLSSRPKDRHPAFAGTLAS